MGFLIGLIFERQMNRSYYKSLKENNRLLKLKLEAIKNPKVSRKIEITNNRVQVDDYFTAF